MATNQGDFTSSYDRLQRDVEVVKTDISKLASQITDTLGDLASAGRHEARRKYNQAKSNVDTIMDDVANQGNAAVDFVQDSVSSLGETLEDAVQQRPFATIGLALALGFLVGVTLRR
jgi:ElaB/YqjD/DUF883 family membrane-anchored ribosome-binding protein